MVEVSSQFPTHRGDEWWSGLFDPLKNISARIADFFAPNAEAAGTSDFYEISVELPGVAEDDIDISIHENTLMISGEKKFERIEEGAKYYFSERSYGRFQRSFRLPVDSDPETVHATHKDGLLTIKIAKQAKKAPTAKKIEINRG